MITPEQLAEAETTVTETAADLAAIERDFARGAISIRAHGQLDDAKLAADHAAARLRLLNVDYADQQQREQQRADAAKTAAKDMARTAKQLTKGCADAATAIVAAEKAMTAALAAVAAHDQLIRAAEQTLRSRGLTAHNGEETGARQFGGLALDGEVWHPVDGPSLLAEVFKSAVHAVYPQHPLGRVTWATYGGPASGAGRVQLLAAINDT